jgi:hypothetical protein
MQLLDDDMDELFRNAASQYPLKTDGANWDAVMSRLPQSTVKPASSFSRLLRWFWKPLLVLMVVVASIPSFKTGDLKPRVNGKAIVEENLVVNEVKKPLKSNDPVVVVNTVPVTNNTNKRTTTSTVNNNNTTGLTLTGTDENVSRTNTTPGLTLTGTDDNVSRLSMHTLSGADVNLSVSAALQRKMNIALPVTPVKEKVVTPVHVEKGLYAGVVASPDISTVKLQRTSKVGYNFGLVAGYRVSKHIAVETGVLVERKYYYSEGSEFSTKKVPIPSDMKILDVDGWCKMIEIPVTVRYVFGIKEKSNWYVNGGLTSYIMGKESYDYTYKMYNTVTTKTWDYKNATRNWFSIIHVGVGYEHKLGAVGTLRVEPYLNIPAGGVGIGSLPITSVGLNVGITRPIRF